MTPDLLQRVRLDWVRLSVNPLRACELCDHGMRPYAGRPTIEHLCLYTGRPVRALAARASGGVCGPEALHQRIDGDDLQALVGGPGRGDQRAAA